MNIDYDGKNFVITGVAPMEIERLKSVSGTRHKRDHSWTMPATLAQALHFGSLFGTTEKTEAATSKLANLVGRAALAMKAKDDTNATAADARLYSYQNQGVNWLNATQHGLLGDDMGLGKTIQAINVAASPLLVVCPNSVKYNWAREIHEWHATIKPFVIDGTAGQRRKQFVEFDEYAGDKALIINFEAVPIHSRLAGFGNTPVPAKHREEKELNTTDWNTIVVDEAHRIKNPKTTWTRGCWWLGKRALKRIAMTGTPMEDNPDDLWSIMHFVEPDEYPARGDFRERYCLMGDNYHGGYENVGLRRETRPEFDRFFMPRFLRRTKEEVLTELPAIVRETRRIPMGTKQGAAYRKMAKDMLARMKDGTILVATDPLVLTARLRALASSSLVGDGDEWQSEAPSNKLTALNDIIAESNGKPLVVYGQSRRLIEMLGRELSSDHRIGFITGSVPADLRAANVDAFQNGDLDLILATTGAGGEGITLTRADTMVIVQQDWSYRKNAQTEARIHRIGQEATAHVITLVSEGTVDEATYAVNLQKEKGFQSLVRDPDFWRKYI